MLKEPTTNTNKQNICKTLQQSLFQEILTHLLKVIRRTCCEQFHVRSISFYQTTPANRIKTQKKPASTPGDTS